MENAQSKMGKQDEVHNPDARSSNNICPASVCQTPTQMSFSEAAVSPSTSADECTDSKSVDDAEAPFIKTARNKSSASPTSKGCLVAEKYIVVAGSTDRKQDGKSKSRDQKPVYSSKKQDINAVKIVDGVVVDEQKQELLSIPQTNFAIGLLVMCCFNPLFGMLALYFSLKAAAAYRDGNKVQGARCARISIVISLLGIMLMMVIISSVVLYIAVDKHSARRGQRRMNSASLGF